jgi:hypothetical protein
MTFITLILVTALPAIGLLAGIEIERNRSQRREAIRRAFRHRNEVK